MPDDIAIQFLEAPQNTKGPMSRAWEDHPLMGGIGILFALHHAKRAFKPNGKFAFTSPLTSERMMCELYAEYLAMPPVSS